MNPLNASPSRVANTTGYNEFSQLVGVYRLLGYALGINLNSLNLDNPVNLTLAPGVIAGAAYYKILAITLNNASLSLNTAQVGVFTATGGGGSIRIDRRH